MKLLIENWRKLLKEADFDIEGAKYAAMVSQEGPAEESEESTMELLNQLDELVKKIKDSIGAAPEEEEIEIEEPRAPGAKKWSRARPSSGPGAEDAPFEE